MPARTLSRPHVYALNLLALAAVAGILFFRHAGYLAEGFDGRTFSLQVRQYLWWSGAGPFFSWNPMQGLGLPASFGEGTMTLNLLPFFLNIPYTMQKVLGFGIAALTLFGGACLLLESLEVETRTALLMAWSGLLCVLPLQFQPVLLGQTYAISLPICNAVSLSLALLGLFGMAGRPRFRQVLVFSGFCLAAALLCTSNFAVALSAPLLIFGGLFLLAASENRREALTKAALVGCALALLAATGLLPWVFGQLMQSARYSLNAEFPDNRPSLSFVSTVFINGWKAKAVVALAVFGGLAALREKQRRHRIAGLFLVSYVGVIAGYAWLYLAGHDLRASLRPVYLEFPLLIIYGMAAGYALLRLARLLADTLRFSVPGVPARALALGAACYMAAIGISTFALKKYRPEPSFSDTTPITRFLQEQTAVAPGGLFRGRAAWLTTWDHSLVPRASASAISLYRPLQLDLEQLNAAHTALEYFLANGIPTAECYNQTLSLPFYLFSSRLCSSATWGPNFTYFSHPNLGAMAAMGIRFLMTDHPLALAGARLVGFRAGGGGGALEQAGGGLQAAAPPPAPGARYVYEIEGVNFGGFSPDTVRVAGTLNAVLEEMGRPGFRFDREVVLAEPAPPDLVPAAAAELRLVRGGLHVSAESPGRSLVLLPFEFTHTARWVPDPGAAPPEKVLRADLVLTGLLFSKRLSGTLVLTPGIFQAGWRRMQDYQDMKAMDLPHLLRRDLHGEEAYYPLFQ